MVCRCGVQVGARLPVLVAGIAKEVALHNVENKRRAISLGLALLSLITLTCQGIMNFNFPGLANGFG
jgi:hypothetical protein